MTINTSTPETMPKFKAIKALLTLLRKDPIKYLKEDRPKYYEKYCHDVDEFGYDLYTLAHCEPAFQYLFEEHFKIKLTGLENIPSSGPALLVGNHSGMLPIDAVMLTMAMCKLHPEPRRIRYLVTDWFFKVPGLLNWMTQTGQVRATLDNAIKLVDKGELVGIYPEGIKGVSKPVKQKYRLIDFNPGYVKLAISKNLPIIPVATLGGDETYMVLKNVNKIARLVKMPFFPITPLFPWLPFPLMFFPLPIQWQINIHKPIYLNLDPSMANNRRTVLNISREIQYIIQKDLNEMYANRRSLFSI